MEHLGIQPRLSPLATLICTFLVAATWQGRPALAGVYEVGDDAGTGSVPGGSCAGLELAVITPVGPPAAPGPSVVLESFAVEAANSSGVPLAFHLYEWDFCAMEWVGLWKDFSAGSAGSSPAWEESPAIDVAIGMDCDCYGSPAACPSGKRPKYAVVACWRDPIDLFWRLPVDSGQPDWLRAPHIETKADLRDPNPGPDPVTAELGQIEVFTTRWTDVSFRISLSEDFDGDGWTDTGGDCDDDSATIFPGAAEVACNGLDDDCDALTIDAPDLDGDSFGLCPWNGDDCDDGDATVWPGAPELCDGLDNACAGAVPADEADADVDGVMACDLDCDDGDAANYPGNLEGCDGQDNDCSGAPQPDEVDFDADGWMECDGDCHDGKPEVYPGAPEQCDGIDGDCDGLVPADETDGDMDQFRVCDGDCADGDAAAYPGAPEGCNGADDDCSGAPEPDEVDGDADGYRVCDGDCADGDAARHPGAAEGCNGVDDNCDGVVPGVEADGDGDGYMVCEDDCDDARGWVNPAATEVCNGPDDNCDGILVEAETDSDADDWLACSDFVQAGIGFLGGDDCDDGESTTFLGAVEVCDAVDNDCDLQVDDGFDVDGDGWPNAPGPACGAIDCDDAVAAVNPGAEEACNAGVDDDCDPDTDENVDGDGDGFTICGSDCDDGSAVVFPGNSEACDALDNNCDGDIDEGFPDADGDGWSACAGDCADTSGNVTVYNPVTGNYETWSAAAIHPFAGQYMVHPSFEWDADCSDGACTDTDCDGMNCEAGDPLSAGDYFLVCRTNVFGYGDRTWTQAREDCDGFGYDLAAIESGTQNVHVASLYDGLALHGPFGAPGAAWIAATDQDVEGAWTWEPHASGPSWPVGYEAWESGFPTSDPARNCAAFVASHGWQDAACGVPKGYYVCSLPDYPQVGN